MIHSLLSSLPDLFEEPEGIPIPELKEPGPGKEGTIPNGATEPAFEDTSSPPPEMWSREKPCDTNQRDEALVESAGELSVRSETLLDGHRESGTQQAGPQNSIVELPDFSTPDSRPTSFVHSEVPSSPNGSLTLDLSTAPSTAD